MSYCLNPECQKPQNPPQTRFCQNCGTPLLLKERYRALKLIGQGGFGRTFLAVDEHRPSHPQCVVKQFFPIAQGTRDVQKASALFEQEAIRLDELGKHSQIPELFAHFTQDQRQYLVQEYIAGQNLAQVLQAEGPFREPQIQELLRSLLPVLGFIHSRNVIHRDLKPDNIIRCTSPPAPSSQLFLVDFGAAKSATDTALLKTGTSIGTPEYIAPEQARGKAVFASDLYSLGVTCLYLMTRVSPFELFDVGEDAWVWRHHLQSNYISDHLGRILDKLVQNAINRRYHTAAEVLQDLQEGGAGQFTPVSSYIPAPSLSPVPVISPPPPPVVSSAGWRCVSTLSGHTQWVRAVAFSPDGKLLASSSEDETIKIWQVSTGREMCTLRDHAGSVNAIAFSHGGKILASGSDDKQIKIWDVVAGKLIRTLGDWAVGEYCGHSDVINAIAITADGKLLVSASKDSTVKLWQLTNPGYGNVLYTLTGHSRAVRCLAINADQTLLASGSEDNTLKIWHLGTRKEMQTLGSWFSGFLNFITSVDFHPHEDIVVSGSWDRTLKIWQVQDGKGLKTLEGHTDYVRTVAFHPDGNLIASGSDDKIVKLWQWDTGQTIANLTGHSNLINTVAWSPDGKLLASGSGDKTIKLWQKD